MPAQSTNPIDGAVGGIQDLVNGAKIVGGAAVGAGKAVAGASKNAPAVVANIASFASDPAGYIFALLKNGAQGLANDVLPALARATEPDLTADWFLNAYKISFATAIFVWVFLLAFQFYRVAKGTLSSRELTEALGPQTVRFFAGAIYGPALSWVMVKFFGALTDVFIGWGVTSAADTTVSSFTKMLNDANVGAIAGGVFVGILLMCLLILSLLMTLGILVVTLVAMYFTGVIFPLGWVWIVSKGHRRHGRRIAVMWVGILIMHSILFFFLGFAFTMMANATIFGEWPDGLKTLVQLLVAVVAMVGAGFAPYKLMKFAPIMPEGSTGQSGGQAGGGDSGGNSYGPSSPRDAQDVARSSGGDGDSSSSSSGGDGGGGQSSDMSWAESTSERKPLSNALSAMKSSGESGAEGASATAGAEAGAASAGVGAGSAAGAAAGASGGAAGGAAAGASGAAAGGAEGMAAAGAAESATGAGAAVGIPTLIAAAAVAGAQKVGQKTTEASNIAMDQAVGQLNDESEGYSNE